MEIDRDKAGAQCAEQWSAAAAAAKTPTMTATTRPLVAADVASPSWPLASLRLVSCFVDSAAW